MSKSLFRVTPRKAAVLLNKLPDEPPLDMKDVCLDDVWFAFDSQWYVRSHPKVFYRQAKVFVVR